MTAETSNARGEWVLERLRGVLEHGKMGDKCLIAPDLVTAAIASLSAPPPAAARGDVWGLVAKWREESCDPCRSVPSRIAKRSCAVELADLLDAEGVQAEPKPEARSVVDDLIHAASNAATIIRNCVNAREIGEGYAQHADDIDAAIAALTGERNG